MTDFRALCAELIRVNDDTDAGDWCRAWDDVTDRARAALAEQPSLKEQALEALKRYEKEEWCQEMTFDNSIIRRALEALPDD